MRADDCQNPLSFLAVPLCGWRDISLCLLWIWFTPSGFKTTNIPISRSCTLLLCVACEHKAAWPQIFSTVCLHMKATGCSEITIQIWSNSHNLWYRPATLFHLHHSWVTKCTDGFHWSSKGLSSNKLIYIWNMPHITTRTIWRALFQPASHSIHDVDHVPLKAVSVTVFILPSWLQW